MSTWYVDAVSGSDGSGDGSLGNPWEHIHYAIDQSSADDVIRCLAGTYDEEEGRQITFNLTIESYPFALNGYKDVIIKPKVLLDGTLGSALYYVTSNKLTLHNVIGFLDKNNITDFGTLTYKTLINTAGSGDIDVTYTYFKADGFSAFGSPVTAIMARFANGTHNIYKCTFRHFNYDDNNDAGLMVTSNTGTYNVKDNLFEDCHKALKFSGTSDEDYNCFYNNVTNSNRTLGSNSITQDPVFVNSTDADIQSSSPCRNAGYIFVGFTDDYFESAPDMGVFEFSILTIPQVTTLAATSIDFQNATLNGNITDIGGQFNDERGFDYGTSPGVYTDEITETGSFNTGAYSLVLGDLTPGTYYFRAKTHNSTGWGYGAELSFEIEHLRFEWLSAELVTSSMDAEWKTSKSNNIQKYHIHTYPLNLDTPFIKDYLFSAPVIGALDSLVIDFDNTGSSGTTEIRLYLEGTLKQTVQITASSGANNQVIELDNSLISRQDQIKVSVVSVAEDCSGFNIAVNQKTFKHRLEVARLFNNYLDQYFESPFLFGKSDEWLVFLNQSVKSIISVSAQNINAEEEQLTYTFGNGDLLNNLITITPEFISDYSFFVIRALDLNDDIKTIHVPVKFHQDFSNYQRHITNTEFSFPSFLGAVKYYYSWDGVTWYGSFPVGADGQITISNFPATAGQNTLRMRYVLDNSDENAIIDSVTVYYQSGDITVTINYSELTLTYLDLIPPQRLDVIVDGTVIEDIDIPFSLIGFDSYTYDEDTYELILAAGIIVTKNETLTFETQTFQLAEAFENPYFVKVLYYDTVSQTFTLEDFADYTFNLVLSYRDLLRKTKIPVYYFVVGAALLVDDATQAIIYQRYALQRVQRVFATMQIPKIDNADVTYRVHDVLGRTKDFVFDEFLPFPDDVAYTVRAEDSVGNPILPGQIHFEDTLTFFMEEDT